VDWGMGKFKASNWCTAINNLVQEHKEKLTQMINSQRGLF
jgi:hypothetical protein